MVTIVTRFPRKPPAGSAQLTPPPADVALRQIDCLTHTKDEIREIIDFICQVATPTAIFYLWRPYLKDPKDDLVLEAVVAGLAASERDRTR